MVLLPVAGPRFLLVASHAASADLDIAGVADADEDSVGRFMGPNSDDDNNNSQADSAESGTVTGEDDLIAMTLAYVPHQSGLGMVTLAQTAGPSGAVRVWTSSTKGTGTQVTLPKTWSLPNDTVPGTLYLEGYSGSSSLRDIEMTLTYQHPQSGTSVGDTIRVTNVVVEVDELGFTSDHHIRVWSAGTEIDPNDNAAIWKRSGNPGFPVAYTKNTAPQMFAKFSVIPSFSTALTNITIRARVGTTTIGSCSSCKFLSSAVEDSTNTDGDVDSIAGGSAVPDSNGVKTLIPTIRWHWTWDGTAWHDAAVVNNLKMHFTDAAPVGEMPYDKALLEACGYVNGNADITGSIRAGIHNETDFHYDASDGTIETHPLSMYYGGGQVCADYANLMACLSRAVGLSATPRIYWGGLTEANTQTNADTFVTPDYATTIVVSGSNSWWYHAVTSVGGGIQDAALGISGISATSRSSGTLGGQAIGVQYNAAAGSYLTNGEFDAFEELYHS